MRNRRGMRWWLMTVLVVSGPAWSEEVLLGSNSADKIMDRKEPLPAGVSVSMDPGQKTQGRGSLRVEYTGQDPVSVPLYEMAAPGVENCIVWCETQLKSAQVQKKAYLEMNCIFPDSGSFFSRALDTALSGDSGWRAVRTPFYLRKGERPSRIQVGVRFEGPGTLWMDDIRVFKGGHYIGQASAWQWIPGTALGVAGGIIGSLAGLFAARGYGRKTVLSAMAILTMASSVLAVAGLACLLTNKAYATWYGLLMPGMLGVVLFGGLSPVVAKRYREAEERRMAALDDSMALGE